MPESSLTMPVFITGANAPIAIRMLTFWNDGFSIGEGSVMLYNDPFSQKILEEINNGYGVLYSVTI